MISKKKRGTRGLECLSSAFLVGDSHAIVVIMFYMLLARCAFGPLSCDLAVVRIMRKNNGAVVDGLLYEYVLNP